MLRQFSPVVQTFLFNTCHDINLKCRDIVILMLPFHCHDKPSVLLSKWPLYDCRDRVSCLQNLEFVATILSML